MSNESALYRLMMETMRKRQGRYQARISQADIARAVEMSEQTVGKWKTGSTPTPANLARIRDLLGISYSDLLDAMLTDSGYLPEPAEFSWDPIRRAAMSRPSRPSRPSQLRKKA